MSNENQQVPLFLYPGDAQKFLGFGTTIFYQLIKLPDFPKARNPLGKRPLYLRTELESWAYNLPAYVEEENKDE